MTTLSRTRFIASLRACSRGASVIVILVGGLALVGWLFDIAALKSVLPGLATMKANTAVCFILAGVSLRLLQKEPASQRIRRVAQGCAFIVALVGLLTLSEYLYGWDMGLDRLLFQEPSGATGTPYPGRMAPTTILTFLLLGAALWLLDTRRSLWPAHVLTLIAAFISFIACVGYVYGIEALYSVGPYTTMALHTALAFLLLCMGILFAHPDRGVMAVVTSNSAGGTMTRRLLPVALSLPVVLGWIRLKGQQAGFYGTEFGLAMFATLNVTILTIFIWWNARKLNRTDTERKRAEEAIRASETRYRALFEDSRDAIYVTTREGLFVDVNPAALELFGYTRSEMIGLDVREIYANPADRDVFQQDIEREGAVRDYGVTFRKKDGTVRDCVLTATVRLAPDGSISGYQGIIRDITERRQLEMQLRQSQKMEAIGQLAGGVAHDFNNMLTVILGYSDLLMQSLDPHGPSYRHIEEVKQAGERAVGLVRQLLAFSRRQILQPQVLDLNTIVANLEKMLRRLLSEDLELVTVLAPTLGLVRTDAGQLEQVLMNLTVNAHDAMPQGGTLTIETANVELDEGYTRIHPGARSGSYVGLTLRDTGVGMDQETLSRIFEPFFTTKEPGKGTGLGLATVYGIVKQSDGYIQVDSNLGRGTSFTIYLPRVEDSVEEREPSPAVAGLPTGTETLLLVEDAAGVRGLARQILQNAGYTVLEAENGEEALRLCEPHAGPIHLLITDVVMPQMSGPMLAKRLASLYPAVKVLYISGYTDDAVVRYGVLEAGLAFLQKPFALDALVRKVREVLDAQ